MRVFIAVLVLIFSLQSLTKADDLRDFEIEGMSIGDSLLDYFSFKQIDNFYNYDYLPSDMKYRIIDIFPSDKIKFNKYDSLQIFYKPKDKKYIIHQITGVIDCRKSTDCKTKLREMENDLNNIFTNNKKHKSVIKHPDDKSGKSYVEITQFLFNSGTIELSFYDWSGSSEINYYDTVRVLINPSDTIEWTTSNYGLN
tara:strand:- start:111 stop:701 length:591 start_codon:yes stop_codon:yes gene_type:complete